MEFLDDDSFSIPALFFIPKHGMPQIAVGALPKSALKQTIAKVLGVTDTGAFLGNAAKTQSPRLSPRARS